MSLAYFRIVYADEAHDITLYQTLPEAVNAFRTFNPPECLPLARVEYGMLDDGAANPYRPIFTLHLR